MTRCVAEQPDASVFQATQALQRAEWALNAFSGYERHAVMRIAEAAAEAGAAKAGAYAKWAVEETGFGVVEHKKLKNVLCSRGILDHYRDQDFTGYRIDPQRKMVEVARPAGVVLALTPSTNPVCSVFYKIMLCLLTRNAVVISPHPAAKNCCADAAMELARAAEEAGAPPGVIQVIAEPTPPVIDALMKSRRTDVILATGGTPMVRAAYGSGNPALGVGPGNCPVYVDASADVAAAAAQIADSKAFDNSVLCTNESAIIAHATVAQDLRRELRKQGCYVCSPAEREHVQQALFPGDQFNIKMLGRSAPRIAQECGLSVPRDTRVLVVPLERIGDDYPLSREKLCPVLGLFEVRNIETALMACRAMVRISGAGHSAAIHAKDPRVILRFGAELDVLRIAVNAPCSVGASGFQTHLAPTMTVGTGFFGRSSVAENVEPRHLVQWVRIAFNKDDAVEFPDFGGLSLNQEPEGGSSCSAERPDSGDVRAEIRRIILEELRALTVGD